MVFIEIIISFASIKYLFYNVLHLGMYFFRIYVLILIFSENV